MFTIQNLKQYMVYGSLTKETYEEVSKLISEENNSTLKGIALINVTFGFILTCLSVFNILSRNPLPAYLFLFVTSAVFLFIRQKIKLDLKKERFITIIQIIAFNTFGILNSTIFAPNKTSNGTIFVVLMLVSAFIYISPPYKFIPLMTIIVAIYCVCTYYCKDPSVHSLDFTNAIAVFFITIMTNLIFTKKSLQGLVNRFYIEKERDTDGLTGLYTKSAGQTLVASELERKNAGALFIIDMDNFKHINDTYGHSYGDEMIVKLSSVIKMNTRRSDIRFRFGGDEFVIYFTKIEREEVNRKISNIFNTMRDAFKDEDADITCSIGIIIINKPELGYKYYFDQADKALYQAKEKGKNTYHIIENLE